MMHIVDDNEAVLNVVSDLVEAFGYGSLRFTSSRDYLDYASSDAYRPPKAVFADVRMPDVDGLTLMHKVRAMHSEVRFVIMSGENSSVQADKLGACIYLCKPIRFDKIEATFEHLRQCLQAGPTKDLAASLSDDREHFGISGRHCPFMSDEQGS